MPVMFNMCSICNADMFEIRCKCTQDGTSSGECKEQRSALMANPFVCNFDCVSVPTISVIAKLTHEISCRDY